MPLQFSEEEFKQLATTIKAKTPLEKDKLYVWMEKFGKAVIFGRYQETIKIKDDHIIYLVKRVNITTQKYLDLSWTGDKIEFSAFDVRKTAVFECTEIEIYKKRSLNNKGLKK